MKEILLEENLKVLKECSSSNTVFGFDYDGTLAPIVDNPNIARMAETTSSLLRELNEIGSVAIITGRSIKDVQRLLPITPKYLIGNHGIEGGVDDEALKEIKVLMRSLKTSLLSKLKAELVEHGIRIEDKMYSLSLHYRNSVSPYFAKKLIENFFKDHTSVRMVSGKMVLNILPNSNNDKGTAFLKILSLENVKWGLFVGDDVTDEDVFSRRDPRVIGIKVGNIENTHASYYIEHQKEINLLLGILIKFIKINLRS